MVSVADPLTPSSYCRKDKSFNNGLPQKGQGMDGFDL
jgi:hypothetical protein